jgi:hypothetical protein
MSPWVTSLLALSLLATPANLPTADGAPDAEVSADDGFPISASVLTELWWGGALS